MTLLSPWASSVLWSSESQFGNDEYSLVGKPRVGWFLGVFEGRPGVHIDFSGCVWLRLS